MLWMGTAQPLVELRRSTAEQDAGPLGFICITQVGSEHAVRAHFGAPFVAYVGSHQGCGCGFESSGLAFDGVATAAEAHALLGAMTPEERDTFLAEQRSREWLRGLVEQARAHGRVELFACWSGDEIDVSTEERTIEPDWLVTQTAPLEERVRYVVAASGT